MQSIFRVRVRVRVRGKKNRMSTPEAQRRASMRASEASELYFGSKRNTVLDEQIVVVVFFLRQ